jgi:hypothetical protein
MRHVDPRLAALLIRSVRWRQLTLQDGSVVRDAVERTKGVYLLTRADGGVVTVPVSWDEPALERRGAAPPATRKAAGVTETLVDRASAPRTRSA